MFPGITHSPRHPQKWPDDLYPLALRGKFPCCFFSRWPWHFLTLGANYTTKLEKENTKEPSPCVIELSLDFPYELEKRFDKMRSEDQDYAELIYDRLLDDGINIGDDLSDENFYKLIKKQFNDILDIANGGFV